MAQVKYSNSISLLLGKKITEKERDWLKNVRKGKLVFWVSATQSSSYGGKLKTRPVDFTHR